MFYANHCETERSISCHCGKGIAGGIQQLVESIMCSEFGGGLRRREYLNQEYCIGLRSALTKGISQFQLGKYSGRLSTLQSISFYPSSSCACEHFCTINTHSLNTSPADRQGIFRFASDQVTRSAMTRSMRSSKSKCGKTRIIAEHIDKALFAHKADSV